MARTVGEETVLLDLASGTYFGLDPVSTRIWHLLSEGNTVAAVCDNMLTEFDVTRDTLEADVASRPNGRLGMVFRIKGRFDPPKRQEANLGVADVISGKAFQKAIPLPSDTPIDLNLDTSLNFDELVRSLSAMWRQDADNSAAVQPPPP